MTLRKGDVAMSTLVESLKIQHLAILNMLTEVGQLGIGTKEGQAKLLAAKTTLIAHLQREDQALYPALRKASESNESLQETLTLFAKDMERITTQVIHFFEQYAQGGSGMTFAQDFGVLSAMLQTRISREEGILYQEYNKLAEAE